MNTADLRRAIFGMACDLPKDNVQAVYHAFARFLNAAEGSGECQCCGALTTAIEKHPICTGTTTWGPCTNRGGWWRPLCPIKGSLVYDPIAAPNKEAEDQAAPQRETTADTSAPSRDANRQEGDTP